VIGIVVDHDVIAIPQPIVAGIVVVRSGLEEETAYVEALAADPMQPPDVLRADGAGETSVGLASFRL
jgi:hypothetical protein